MGFRELYCNTADENGTVSKRTPPPDCFEAEDDVTLMVVEGSEIEKCWARRHETFLTTEAHRAGPISEAHLGEGKYVYYRGIRIHDLQEPALFNYNIRSDVSLTEDRTLKYAFEAKAAIVSLALAADDSDFIETILTAPKGYFENGLSFETHLVPSDTFLDTVERLWSEMRPMNLTSRKIYRLHRKVNLNPEDSVALNNIEREKLDRALAAVEDMGCLLNKYPVIVVDSFEEDNIMGKAEDDRIYISRNAFDMGTKYLASTIYEEYIHLDRGLHDCTREMQNYLFEKLFSEYERRKGVPL